MRFFPMLALVALGGSFGASCGSSETPSSPGQAVVGSASQAPWFAEVHGGAGLDFLHTSGASSDPAAARRFPEIMGGGAALCDLDADGDLDLYLVQSGELEGVASVSGGNRLYENVGGVRFRDVTADSGAADEGYGMGVAFGDVDNDGRGDLFVTNVGTNALYRNAGALSFARADWEDASGSWSTSAAMLDYDGDGDLDVYACNYVEWSLEREIRCSTVAGKQDYCSPNSYDAPAVDTLLRNDGAGAFRDISREAGLYSRRGNGLGVVCGDFDADGRVDVFVANDQMENHLWHNVGDGTFTDVAIRLGCAVDQHGKPKAGMGTLAEDIDDDGDLDLLVVNLRAQADSFFRNEGGFFIDDTAAVGLGSSSRPFTRFGVGCVDFDNDGHLDLYEANGRVAMFADPNPRSDDPYAEPNLLFRGLPGGRFQVFEPEGGVAAALVHTSRAAAFGDVDSDGGIDIVVVNRDAHVYLLHNIHEERGDWIRFSVLDRNGRHALGAEVTIPMAERTLRRDVRSGYSYCAANDPRIHIGLGQASRAGASAALESVHVRWPEAGPEGLAVEETFGPFEVGRDHVLRFGRGTKR